MNGRFHQIWLSTRGARQHLWILLIWKTLGVNSSWLRNLIRCNWGTSLIFIFLFQLCHKLIVLMNSRIVLLITTSTNLPVLFGLTSQGRNTFTKVGCCCAWLIHVFTIRLWYFDILRVKSKCLLCARNKTKILTFFSLLLKLLGWLLIRLILLQMILILVRRMPLWRSLLLWLVLRQVTKIVFVIVRLQIILASRLHASESHSLLGSDTWTSDIFVVEASSSSLVVHELQIVILLALQIEITSLWIGYSLASHRGWRIIVHHVICKFTFYFISI